MTRIRIPKTTAGVHSGPKCGVGDRLDHADDQAADHGALEVADAAHDRRGERDQAGGEALVEADRAVVERVDQPAAPAIRPPSRKVSWIVRSTLMPIRRAASGSCAVARMALP